MDALLSFLTSNVVGLLGLCITSYTLLKVRSVAKAQSQERELMRKLFGIDELILCLRSASSFLGRQEDDFAREIANTIVNHIGKLDGIQKTLELQGKIQNSDKANLLIQSDGHFSMDYLKTHITNAQSSFDIIVMRNLVCSNFEMMGQIRQACQRGVKVRFLSLSPDAEPKIISSLLKTLPVPKPRNEAHLTEQLKASQSHVIDIVEEWTPQEKACFEYRVYDEYPTVHAVMRDSKICIGFPVTRASTQEESYTNRPYIEIDTKINLGRQFQQHYNEIWNEAKPLLLDSQE